MASKKTEQQKALTAWEKKYGSGSSGSSSSKKIATDPTDRGTNVYSTASQKSVASTNSLDEWQKKWGNYEPQKTVNAVEQEKQTPVNIQNKSTNFLKDPIGSTKDFIKDLGTSAVGGLKNTGASDIDAMRTMYASGQGGRDTMASNDLAMYTYNLNRAKVDYEYALKENDVAGMRMAQNEIDRYQKIIDGMNMAKNSNAQQKSVEETAKIADSIQESATNDIQKAKAGRGTIGQMVMDTAASTAQMGADMAVNAALSAQGFIPFAMRAYGGGTQQARQNGATLGQQNAYGAAVAAKEIATELMFNIATPFKTTYGNGSLDSIVEGAIDKTIAKLPEGVGANVLKGLMKTGANAGGEALEEFVGDWIEWQLPRIYNGDVESASEVLSQSLYDLAVGAMSGLAGEVAMTPAANFVNDINYKARYGSQQGKIVENTLGVNPESELANKAQSRLDEGKNLSGKTLRKLSEEYDTKVSEYDSNKISTAVKERLGVLGEKSDVDVLTSAITKTIMGEGLTTYENKVLKNSKYGNRVVNELNDYAGGTTSKWTNNIGTKRSRVAMYNKDSNVVIGTGEKVDVTAEKSDSDGNITYKASNGKTYKAEEIKLSNEQAQLNYLASDFGGAASTFVNMKSDSQNIDQYYSEFNMAYKMGTAYVNNQNGLELTKQALAKQGTILNDAQITAAYSAGQATEAMKAKQASKSSSVIPGTVVSSGKTANVRFDYTVDRNTLTSKQSAEVNALDKLAKVTGVRFVLYNSETDANGRYIGANGRFDKANNIIYLDVNAGAEGTWDTASSMLRTAGHEFTHFIQKNSPEKYEQLKEFVTKHLIDSNKSIEELAQEKIDRASFEMTFDEAIDEVIADACEMMLKDSEAVKTLANENMSLFKSLKKWLDNFLNSLRKAFEGVEATHEEARAMLDVADEIQRIWDDALVDAVRNFNGVTEMQNQSGETVGVAGETGQSVFSTRTYDEGGREKLRKFLDGRVKKKSITKAEAKEMMDQMESIYNLCQEYAKEYTLFGEWSTAEVKINPETGMPVFSVVKANGDYAMNLDFSLVCKKRRTLDAVFNQMIEDGIMDNFDMVERSIAAINDVIRSNDFETACALCFVDSKRYRQALVADSFKNIYNEIVMSMVKEGQHVDYFNFGGSNLVQSTGNGINTLKDSDLDFTKINEILNDKSKEGTVEWKVAKDLKQHPEDRKLVMRGDFMSTAGFDNLKQNNQRVLSLYNAKKGAGGPKAAQSDVQYLSEILAPRKFNVKKAYSVGGVRIQSFSDYIPRLVFDYVQMIADLSAKELPAHAYTKEPMFALQFGKTGVKVNMILVPEVIEGGVAPGLDADGNYAWRDGQSFGSTVYGGSKEFIKKCFDIIGKKYNGQDRLTAQEGYELALAIQNADGYHNNCGTIAVGISDEHVRKLLRDDNIRMVIPYHKSSLNHLVAVMTNIDKYFDYTNYQNTRDANGKKLEKDKFNFNDELMKQQKLGKGAKEAAQAYLDYCDKNHYIPKFDQFRNEENYYKLLEDFTTYDRDGAVAPQTGVTLNLPTETDAFGSLKEMIKMGLEEDALLQAKQDKAVPKIVKEIQATLPSMETAWRGDTIQNSDRDAKVNNAVERFGTTEDYNEAAFILPDGRMLKFSNKAGERTYDHRAIGVVYGKNVDLEKNHGFNYESNKDLEDFIESGSIRFDPGEPQYNIESGMQLSSNVPLTKEQEQTVRDFIQWKKDRETKFEKEADEETRFMYDGPLPLNIEFGGDADHTAASENDLKAWGKKGITYLGGSINPDRVIADIRNYYRTGEVRQPSNLSQFFQNSDRDTYSYKALTAKPDIKVVTFDKYDVPTKGKKVDMLTLSNQAKGNASVLSNNGDTQRYVFIPDINSNVLIKRKGIEHGLLGNITNTSTMSTAEITKYLPEILRNSIAVNEEYPRSAKDGTRSYILFGYVRRSDGDEYTVKSTIHHFDENKSIISDVNIFDVLKGSRAKKIDAGSNGTKKLANHAPESSISISVASLLDIVNELYPQFLPEEIRKHFNNDVKPEDNLIYSERDINPSQISTRSILKKATAEDTNSPAEADALRIYQERLSEYEDLKQKYTGESSTIKEADYLPDVLKAKNQRKVLSDQLNRAESQLEAAEKSATIKKLANRLRAEDAYLIGRIEQGKQMTKDFEKERASLTKRNESLEKAKASAVDRLTKEKERTANLEKMYAGRKLSEVKRKNAEEIARLNDRIAQLENEIQNNKEIQNVSNDVIREQGIALKRQGTRVKNAENRIQEMNEIAERRRANRADSEARQTLLRIANRLNNKKLPAATRQEIDDLIGELDLVSVNMTGQTIEKLTDLKNWYETERKTNPNFYGDDATEEKIARLQKISIGNMSIEDVKQLTDVLKNIENTIRTQNKFIDSVEKRTTQQAGMQVIEDIESSKGVKPTGLDALIDKVLNNQVLSPLREVRRITGYKENDPLVTAINELSDGQRNMFQYKRKAEDMFTKWTNDKEFMKSLSGKHSKTITVPCYIGNTLSSVKIDPAMRMTLYLHSLARDNMRHIEGGIKVPDMDLYRKGNFSAAYDRGQVVRFKKSQLEAITSQMTPKEKAYAWQIHEYFNKVSNKAINETSEKLVGYSLAQIENYFPINVDKDFSKADYANLKLDGTIEGMGFLKDRVNSKLPMVLADVTDILDRSIEQHSKYVGLGIPVRNMSKLMGVTEVEFNESEEAFEKATGEQSFGYTDSVINAIKRKWGSDAADNISKLMNDLQSGKSDIDFYGSALNKLTSNYAGAVLELSLGTAIKQAASYPTAAAVLGWGPLVTGFAKGRVNRKIVDTYTPLLYRRTIGFSTQELGQLADQQKMMPKYLNWISGADIATTTALWNSAEAYVDKNFKLKKGSYEEIMSGNSEYYKKVAEIYNRVIEETQPNYTVLQRSTLQRSPNQMTRLLNMFKTQPFQNYNILYDAFGEYEANRDSWKKAKGKEKEYYAKKLSDSSKNLGRAITSQAVASLVFSIMQMAWDSIRRKDDKYKDDEGEWTILSALRGIGLNMVTNGFGMLPFGSEIFSWLASTTDSIVEGLGGDEIFGTKFYGTEVSAIESVNDILTDTAGVIGSTAMAIGKIIDGDDKTNPDWEKLGRSAWSCMEDLAKVAGIPLENIETLGWSIAKPVMEKTLGKYAGSYEAIKITSGITSSSAKKQAYDILYDAYKNNRSEHKNLYNQMLKDGFKEESIKSAMETRMKEEQGVKSVKDLKTRYKP